jgi:hypothetical protein
VFFKKQSLLKYIMVRGDLNVKNTVLKILLILLLIFVILLGAIFKTSVHEISVTPKNGLDGTVRIWIFGLLISVVLGNLITSNVMKSLRKRLDRSNPASEPGKFTPILGGLEALAYTIAWVQDFPTFIVVWLGIKMAGRWKVNETQKGVTNIFLIGSLLNVIFSVFGAATIKYLLQNGWNFKISF